MLPYIGFAIACQVNHLPLFFHLWLNIRDKISSSNTIITQYHARGRTMSHILLGFQLRQAALQEQQEQHKARMQEKHRMRLERGEEEEEEQEEERSGEEVVPGDSVSNQGEGAVEEGTDDAKLKRLSTAERKVQKSTETKI